MKIYTQVEMREVTIMAVVTSLTIVAVVTDRNIRLHVKGAVSLSMFDYEGFLTAMIKPGCKCFLTVNIYIEKRLDCLHPIL